MKARIIEIIPEITLTVSMIVKNEEKNLPKCLEALKPLLDAVKSELIITDTGSTDKTVEIAGQYTDKVLHFEWIDDFSAARNYGLKKAQGEWFMFLDADEMLDEDISEMVVFFNDRELNKKYNSATFMMKDFTNQAKTTWTSNAKFRIVRRNSATRFKNKIHETLVNFPDPCYGFKTIVTHAGYVYESYDDLVEKHNRNLAPMLEQVRKNPDDLRALTHLIGAVVEEEKEEVLNKALALARKKRDHTYSQTVFLHAMMYYYEIDNLKTIEYADEYLNKYKDKKSILLLDVYAIKANCLVKLNRIEEALESYEGYFKAYDLNSAGLLDASQLLFKTMIFNDKTHYKLLKTRYEELKGGIT